jgi:hypothetical protein
MKDFSHLHSVQTGSSVQLASYRMGSGGRGISPGLEQSGREDDRSPPSMPRSVVELYFHSRVCLQGRFPCYRTFFWSRMHSSLSRAFYISCQSHPHLRESDMLESAWMICPASLNNKSFRSVARCRAGVSSVVMLYKHVFGATVLRSRPICAATWNMMPRYKSTSAGNRSLSYVLYAFIKVGIGTIIKDVTYFLWGSFSFFSGFYFVVHLLCNTTRTFCCLTLWGRLGLLVLLLGSGCSKTYFITDKVFSAWNLVK